MDLVSCVISTYKRDIETLERAAFSIIRQTYQNIELIIVNDAVDNVVDVERIRLEAERNHRKFQYLVNRGEHGACNTRNLGAVNSSGEYIAFLDDDDEWLPQKIEKQLAAFSQEDIGLVWCDNYIRKEGTTHRHLVRNTPSRIEPQYLGLLVGNYIGSTSFPMLRRKAFFEAGQFDPKVQSSQDCDMWIRIVMRYKAVYIPEPLINYYVSAVSISTDPQKRINGYNYLLKKYEKHYLENPHIHVERLNGIIGAFLFYGELSEAKQYLKILTETHGKNKIKKAYLAKRWLVGVRKKLLGY